MGAATQALEVTYDKHPTVWSDEVNRLVARAHMISNGTEYLLDGDHGPYYDGKIAGGTVLAVACLEQYNPKKHSDFYDLPLLDVRRKKDFMRY